MGILAVVNQKGGVGKTTVGLGLASAAMVRGRSVLVVDMDPQANATTGLGVFEVGTSTDEVLAADEPGAAAGAVVTTSWRPSVGEAPDLVPSAPRLAQREHQLATDPIGAQDRLRVALDGVADRYDDVIIDCPPSLGLLTVNALFAADRVLIVAEPAAWSLDGVEQILRNVGRIAERRSGRPQVAGIVVNRFGRTRDAAYWYEQLRETHGPLLLAPAITARAAVAEAAAQSLPVHLLRRDGAAEAAEQFATLLRALEPVRRVHDPMRVTPPPHVDAPAAPSGQAPPPSVVDATPVAEPYLDLSGSAVPLVAGLTSMER